MSMFASWTTQLTIFTQVHILLHGYPVHLSVFSGRLDHARHLKNIIKTASKPVQFRSPWPTIHIQRINTAKILRWTLLSNRDGFVQAFSEAAIISVHYDPCGQWGYPVSPLEPILSDLDQAGAADEFVLAIATVGGDVDGAKKAMLMWTLCPRRRMESKCFVGREGLNNTSVLVDELESAHHIAGYFFVSDQICGSQVVEIDKKNTMNIKFRPRVRRGMLAAHDPVERGISTEVDLAGEVFDELRGYGWLKYYLQDTELR
jgi:hypothetical protein